MLIDVAMTADDAKADQIRDRLVCVIDVLRASTSITAALAAGAAAVWPEASLEAAYARRDALQAAGKSVVLAGERNANPPPGFDLGNSPQAFKSDLVGGREVVLTTTNGTRALVRAAEEGAHRILVAALVNVDAVVREVRAASTGMPHPADAGSGGSGAGSRPAGILLYAAGSEGRVSLEDTACAGLIARELSLKLPVVQMTDSARVAVQTYVSSAGHWPRALLTGSHARNLAAKGYQSDLEYCLRVSILHQVGLWKDGRIVRAQPA